MQQALKADGRKRKIVSETKTEKHQKGGGEKRVKAPTEWKKKSGEDRGQEISGGMNDGCGGGEGGAKKADPSRGKKKRWGGGS